jgi:hypothetical protein
VRLGAPLLLLLLPGLSASCAGHPTPRDAGSAPVDETPRTPVTWAGTDTRLITMDQMIASIEMQLSGEPLAEAMGRDLGGYDRNQLPPDLYKGKPDLAGYSAAVESYEYSKQPMNMLAFESGSGVSLAWGPMMGSVQRLQDAVQTFGWASRATSLNTFDSGLGSALNPLGWPGFWPTLHPYRSFDPTIAPTDDVSWRCSLAGDETSTRAQAVLFEDYECDANSLHLTDREAQVEKVITPGASGWTDWKESLWVMNYLQLLHDSLETPVTSVQEADMGEVGLPNNLVRANDPDTFRGVFLGSSNVEGFQAGFLITGMDNQLQHWLASLTTTDGTTLSGFADLSSALAYDFTAPLRWLPAEIAVTETSDSDPFPHPSGYAIQSSESHLLELAGMLGGAANLYALTDRSNASLGDAQTVRAWFDGDPFPADNQLPDGEATLHDRSLAMIRFVVVTMDRLHADSTDRLSDTVTFDGALPSRGSTIDTASVTYTLMALRQARRAITSQLELYSNNSPDTASAATVLDTLPFHGAPGGATFAQRLTSLIEAQSELLLNQLTTADGQAWSGWNSLTGHVTDQADALDAHTAAIRGLLIAYLATGDTRYRDRALLVFQRLDQVFFDPSARLYTSGPQPMEEVSFTPRRFGLLQGALRDLYLLVGSRPGQEKLGALLELRLARLNKLVLNGWDDRNGDGHVDWPDECIHVVDGLPRGGLQLAERGLTGETGSLDDSLTAETRTTTTDREHDCVPDITAAHLPAALAHEIRLKLVHQ